VPKVVSIEVCHSTHCKELDWWFIVGSHVSCPYYRWPVILTCHFTACAYKLLSVVLSMCSFPGLKQLVHGVDHPRQSSADVKERVELYLFFREPSWPVLGWKVPFIFSYEFIYIRFSSACVNSRRKRWVVRPVVHILRLYICSPFNCPRVGLLWPSVYFVVYQFAVRWTVL